MEVVRFGNTHTLPPQDDTGHPPPHSANPLPAPCARSCCPFHGTGTPTVLDLAALGVIRGSGGSCVCRLPCTPSAQRISRPARYRSFFCRFMELADGFNRQGRLRRAGRFGLEFIISFSKWVQAKMTGRCDPVPASVPVVCRSPPGGKPLRAKPVQVVTGQVGDHSALVLSIRHERG